MRWRGYKGLMVLVCGAKGMLGSDLMRALAESGTESQGLDREELDITDPEAIARLAAGEFGRPDWIINCAAYTAVDKAETERQSAFELNAIAPGYLANAASALGAKLIHISTDFVFDGAASEPYREDAPTHPLGIYGESKRDGEEAVLSANPHAIIVRTSWLYGAYGNSFPRTMIRALQAGRKLRVVADQTGCPTYTGELAHFILHLMTTNAHPGIYHGVGPEAMTWHEFALRAIQAFQRSKNLPIGAEIEPIATADWPTPAQRPKYSVLANTKAQFPIQPVDQSLEDFVSKADLSL